MSNSEGSEIQVSLPKSSQIFIRDYNESDNEGCILLDESDDSLKHWGGYLVTMKKYITTFHAIMQNTKDSIIIVAEDRAAKQDSPKIVGVVHLAIRDAIYGGKETRIGFVGGLRVSPEYRRGGLATKLMETLEARGRERGVMLYEAAIVGKNEASLNLFINKMKYKHIGNNVMGWRSPDQKDIPGNEIKIANGTITLAFKQIGKEEIIEHWKEYYKGCDFVPVDWHDVTNHPQFRNAYMVSSADGSIKAGIVRARHFQNRIYYLAKLFVPTTYYFSWAFNSLVTGAIAGIAYGVKWALSRIKRLPRRVDLGVAAVVGVGLFSAYYKLAKKARENARINKDEVSEGFIGGFYLGEEKYKDETLSYLMKRAIESSKSDGAHSIVIMTKEKDDFFKYVPNIELMKSAHVFKVLEPEKFKDETAITERIFSGFTY